MHLAVATKQHQAVTKGLSMKFLAFVIVLLALVPLHACSLEHRTVEVAFCNLVDRPVDFQNRLISVKGVAKGLSSYFDLVLTDGGCPGKYVAIVADGQARNKKGYLTMVKRLYPGYPDTFDNTDAAVVVNVTGRFFQKKQSGLVTKYLKAETVELVK
jgi:hypothetical protein